MKRIGIFSDTHGKWDNRFIEYFRSCDEIWHAGDIGDYTILENLKESLPHAVVRAVCGNADFGEVKRKYSDIEIFEVEEIKVLLTHIGGYPGKWASGMRTLIKENDIRLVVDGHSHILKIMFDSDLDVLLINPGAAGQQGWHKKRTLVRLTIDSGDMRDCEVIELA